MPCESCAVQFSVFKRKRVCCECERYYCSGCLRRGGGAMCAPCRVLSNRPLSRNTISHLKVRDLQCFLQRQNISTRGCVEKDELVSLCVCHVNSASYRRRGARSAGAFSSLKGLTTNINDFISSAFDLRAAPAATPAPAPPPPQPSCHSNNCLNASHGGQRGDPAPERFTPTPGGEHRIEVSPPVAGGGAADGADSGAAPRVDTADCFEIEDLDDAGWELVGRPADPLPNDSDILLTTESGSSPAPPPQPPEPSASPSLASSHSNLEGIFTYIHRAATLERLTTDACAAQPGPAEPAAAAANRPEEPAPRPESPPPPPPAGAVTLDSVASEEQLGALSVRQLKELLARNRVAAAGCVERGELLELAARLWRAHGAARAQLDALPLEECCKICMAAPLECVLLECGHIAACTACAARLAECPICRRYVVRAVRFFRS